MTEHDLLSDPLLAWRDDQLRIARATLPGILARLGSGELADFPRVRTHQFHPWNMFLIQLAAIALRRAGETSSALSESLWRERLLALSEQAHEPWCLLVDDAKKPAFFQPPVASGEMENWRVGAASPDDLDVLVTAKAHDVKRSVIRSDDAEQWAYALCTLQSTQGFLGAGNYGISRMNGGFATRVRVGLSSTEAVAGFTRDVAVLLDTWQQQLDSGYSEEGAALTWTVPWDGTLSLQRGDLSPHFIEVCRRVRLSRAEGGYVARTAPTRVARCLPGSTGDVGDPWIPIHREDATALNVGRRGFDYKLTAQLLVGEEYKPSAAQEHRLTDGDPVLLQLSALARGQGKTEGLHERTVPLSGKVLTRLGQSDQRAALGRRAMAAVARAELMRGKVLFPALKRLAGRGSVTKDRFDAAVDERFFEELFAGLDEPEDDTRLHWDQTLKGIAEAEFEGAISRSCLPDARRYREISEAEGLFIGCMRKHFPDLFAAQGESR